MVRYEVPVFMEEGWYIREAWKGITIREKRRSNVENVCFIEEKISTHLIKKIKKIKKWKDDKEAQVGIVLCSSQTITKLIEYKAVGFLLIAPLSSVKILNDENIFLSILSKWEARAIRNFIENTGSEISHVQILTDFYSTDNPYLQPFKEILLNGDTTDNIKTKASEVDSRTCVVIGDDKRKLILDLERENKKRAASGDEEIDLIITTSSFENWLMPNRQKFKDVHYAYPKLSSTADVVMREFEEEYGYKPSVCALLGYDAADIAIKSIVESGPSYEGIKHYLTQNTFELITVGKMGFSAEGVPYLIGKKGEDVFGIKYVDKDGEFKALKE
jgi:hypothetical protein